MNLTIGVPVYNEQKNILKLIKSLKKQSYKDFEIIISDNFSSDKTLDLIKKNTKNDKRFKIYKQKKNIGSQKNFEFVFKKAKKKYFMWLAADDLLSTNFVERNLYFLENNSNYIGSTSKNNYNWRRKFSSIKDKKFVKFKLDKDIDTNLITFLKNINYSHAIFYSIFRRNFLKKCSIIKHNFYAGDWGIMLFMTGCGKINRDLKSEITFGTQGISYKKQSYKTIVNKKKPLFPLYKFSIFFIKFILRKNLSILTLMYAFYWIIRKNIKYYKKEL